MADSFAEMKPGASGMFEDHHVAGPDGQPGSHQPVAGQQRRSH